MHAYIDVYKYMYIGFININARITAFHVGDPVYAGVAAKGEGGTYVGPVEAEAVLNTKSKIYK